MLTLRTSKTRSKNDTDQVQSGCHSDIFPSPVSVIESLVSFTIKKNHESVLCLLWLFLFCDNWNVFGKIIYHIEFCIFDTFYVKILLTLKNVTTTDLTQKAGPISWVDVRQIAYNCVGQ